MDSASVGTPEIVVDRPSLVVATHDDLFLCGWRGVGSLEDLQTLNSVHEVVAAKRPRGKIAEVCITTTAMVRPVSEDIRREINRRATELAPTYIAGAMVVLGDGFGASVLRSVLGGALLLRRSHFPYRSFSSIDLASDWLGPHIDMTGGELAALVHSFHRRIMA
ncbi:MAG: hypothetical protein HOV80_19805 [Polyangiaceae bacterium]|nr:hypothetical protein [Polyangiaceae bacterium]